MLLLLLFPHCMLYALMAASRSRAALSHQQTVATNCSEHFLQQHCHNCNRKHHRKKGQATVARHLSTWAAARHGTSTSPCQQQRLCMLLHLLLHLLLLLLLHMLLLFLHQRRRCHDGVWTRHCCLWQVLGQRGCAVSCALLRCILLRCILLRCILLRCILLRCILLRCILLRCILLRCILLRCILLLLLLMLLLLLLLQHQIHLIASQPLLRSLWQWPCHRISGHHHHLLLRLWCSRRLVLHSTPVLHCILVVAAAHSRVWSFIVALRRHGCAVRRTAQHGLVHGVYDSLARCRPKPRHFNDRPGRKRRTLLLGVILHPGNQACDEAHGCE
jgi:hypothetical protein